MDVNFEYKEEGINLQAMDNSHLVLFTVTVKILVNGFKRYRCDWPCRLGVNWTSPY